MSEAAIMAIEKLQAPSKFLSPRERAACALLLQGLGNKDIAAAMGTTEQVIKNLFRAVYARRQLNSRVQLALSLYESSMVVQ